MVNDCQRCALKGNVQILVCQKSLVIDTDIRKFRGGTSNAMSKMQI